MTREEAVSTLRYMRENGDTEMAHMEADRILCELLSSLGYEDVVEEWSKIHKWYA